MSPAAKVAHGLELAAEGFAALRAERARLGAALAANREAIAGGEGQALALRYEAMRNRSDRVTALPAKPRERLRDGVLVGAPSIAEETAKSLALYVPSSAGKAAPPALRRGLLARMLRLGP